MLTIPADLLPRDGRFGSGPAKIRSDAVAELASDGARLLGTSHRQPPVRGLVHEVREGLAALFALPDGYEVVLGNGGSSLFWDLAVCSLIERRSAHASFGEFSAKFAAAAAAAPHLEPPVVTTAPAGSVTLPEPVAGVDAYAWAHNETSTGAIAPIRRLTDDALMIVDGTSAAGGVELDVGATDVYYFAPQKSFGSDGGLWLALLSPAAIERTERIAGSNRWIPESLSLATALANARLDQTLNTPAIATLYLLARQLEWLNDRGGLAFAAARTQDSSSRLYAWAEASPIAQPFVEDPAARSPVVGTIDFTGVEAAAIASTLRSNGILDTEPYRKLGRNQLRIAMFPNIEPDDVSRLVACVDWIAERL